MVKLENSSKSFKVSNLEFEQMNKTPVSNEFCENASPVVNIDDIKNYYFDDEEQWYYNPIEIEMRCREDFINVLQSDENELKCKNIGLKHCNKYVHNIIDKMLSQKLRLYLFNWDDVPGKDSIRFKDFLKKCYGLEWLDNLEFMKTDEEIITIYDSNHFLSLSIKNENIILIIQDSINQDIRDEKYFLKLENKKKNIYFKYFKGGLFKDNKYPIFDENQCIQYIHEYVPFHLPQINQVIGDILRKNIFDENQTIGIMDIGSGPATVPLALCRLNKDEFQKKKFNITTVEASEACNDKIDTFKNSNKNKPIYLAQKYKYDVLDFMRNVSDFKRPHNWIIIANALSAIFNNNIEKEKYIIFKTFIRNILRNNIKYGQYKILLTIIEGKSKQYCDVSKHFYNFQNIVFNDFTVTPIELSPKYNGNNIDSEWIKNCEFYNFKYENMFRPALYSTSLLLELKND